MTVAIGLGLLASAAHAQDNACARLEGLIRNTHNCCGTGSAAPVCAGLLKAASALGCGDNLCSPCYTIGYTPAAAACGCTMDPSDPNVAFFPGAVPFACVAPEYSNLLICCVAAGDPLGTGGATCQTTASGATFVNACY